MCPGCEVLDKRVIAEFWCSSHQVGACQWHRFQLHALDGCQCEAVPEDLTESFKELLNHVPNSTDKKLRRWVDDKLLQVLHMDTDSLRELEKDTCQVLQYQ